MIVNLQYYVTILIGLTAIIGDHLVNSVNLQLYKAIIDNATHAIIGGLSWLIVSLKYKSQHPLETVLDIICCTIISSFIDLDHFITAKSFRLKEATNLKRRPFLHCSTIPIAIILTLLPITHLCHYHSAKKYVFIAITAFYTHHTRDATRRGYWIYPLGSTPPIPYTFYLFLTITAPFAIIFIRNQLNIAIKPSTTVHV